MSKSNSDGAGDRLLRAREILAPDGPIPLARSTWYDGVRSGRFPQPVKLGRRATAWRASDIHALMERGALGVCPDESNNPKLQPVANTVETRRVRVRTRKRP